MASRLNVSNLNISSGGVIKLPSYTTTRPVSEQGLLIFTQEKGVEIYNGTEWKSLGGKPAAGGSSFFVSGTQSFTSTGIDQSWAVPNNIVAIRVWMWGAGGTAGGHSSAGLAGGNGGGAGALVAAIIQVTPGEVLTIRVGQSAVVSQISAGATSSPNYNVNPFGGGGGGGIGDGGGANGSMGCPGGGATSILRGSTFVATAAGGGGGGGPGYPATVGGDGGAGGTGNGNGGLGPGSVAGEGNNGSNGGGGGGGGGSGSSQNQGSGIGGNGGSNLLPSQPIQINGVAVTPGTSSNGSGRQPGNNNTANKYPTTPANVGVGGQATTTNGAALGGGNGFVFIEY